MDSKIYLKEQVDNKDRKFGSATEYYPTYIIDENGNEIRGLFTKDQVAVAIRRANKNPEDFKKEKSIWTWIFNKF